MDMYFKMVEKMEVLAWEKMIVSLIEGTEI